MKIMIELQIQKKRDEYFPNNLLSNYYFNIWCNNELLIFEEIDEKVWSKIVEDLASSYYFIFPLFLEPSSELWDNWKIKFITEKSMEYWWLISNHNYWPSEELEQKSWVLDILWFYKKIDLRWKRNLEEFVRHWLRFSWTYESPILVNFEEKIIVWFFEWWLKVLIYNKKKRLEVMEKYSQYMRNKE
jgi:hypothetical protein